MAKYGQPLHLARDDARLRFLRAIEKRVPDVLTDLKKVLPTYRAATKKESASKLYASKRDPSLENVIKKWRQTWRLDVDWMRDEAFKTLGEWEKRGSPTPLKFQRGLWFEEHPDFTISDFEQKIEFKFSHPGWNPFRQTWEEAYEGDELGREEELGVDWGLALRPALDRAIEEYRRTTADLAERSGYELHGGYRPKDQDFRWLVDYQINAEPFSRIPSLELQDCKVKSRHISRAVQRLAKLIELPLRPPDKGGRPRS